MSVSDTESTLGAVGGRGSEERVTGPMVDKPSNLSLLLKVVQVCGKPLPVGSFTAWVVADKVKKLTGHNPVEVEIVSGQDVVLDFEPDVSVVEVAQKMHGPYQWEGMNTNIACLMLTRKSILNIVEERIESRVLQKEAHEQRKVKEEERKNIKKLEGLLEKFGKEVE